MNWGITLAIKQLILDGASFINFEDCIRQLCEMLPENVLAESDERLIRRYLNFLQLTFTEIIDQLGKGEIGKVYTDVERREITCLLFSVINNLKKYFGSFYDSLVPLPMFVCARERAKLERKSKAILVKLKFRLESPMLLNILDEGQQNFFLLKTCNSSELDAQNILLDSIKIFCDSSGVEDFDDKLIDLLIGLDYRSSIFIAYCTAQIDAELDIVLSKNQRLVTIKRYRRRLLALELGSANSRLGPNLTLKFMTAYLANLPECDPSGMSQKVESYTQVSASEQLIKSNRLKVSFSVDVLAYITRLLVDCKYIIPTSKINLFNFLGTSIKTQHMGERRISVLSIGNKYHTTVQSTAMETRAMFQKMIKQIDGQF